MGLGLTVGDGERAQLNIASALAPRISLGAIASAGGTVDKLIDGLIETIKYGTMDVRERSAAALHSLAEQAKEHAELIVRGGGLVQLVGLLISGSPDAQAHAAAAIGSISRYDPKYQVRVMLLPTPSYSYLPAPRARARATPVPADPPRAHTPCDHVVGASTDVRICVCVFARLGSWRWRSEEVWHRSPGYSPELARPRSKRPPRSPMSRAQKRISGR